MRHGLIRYLFFGVLAVSTVVASRVVLAESSSTAPLSPEALAEKHSRLGVAHYQAERYPEAVAEMLLAYQAVPDADLLYNIARIYEKLSEFGIAIAYYQRFVVLDAADPARVQKALKHLQRLKQIDASSQNQVARIEAPKNTEVKENPGIEESVAAPPKSAPQESVSVVVKNDDVARSDSLFESTLPWALFGLGLASTGVGAWYGARALDSSVLAADMNAKYGLRVAAQVSGDDEASLADAFYVGGGVLLLSGLAVKVLWPETSAANAQVLITAPSPDAMQVNFRGRF